MVSYRKESLLEKIHNTHSMKGFAKNFLLKNMAGQKLFLYNNRVPRVVNISFNEKTCMFSCKMCPYSEEKVRTHYKEKSEMTAETLENLIKNTIPNDSAYGFDISAIGETLDFQPLSRFIERMKKQKSRVSIALSTNGLCLDEEKFAELSQSGLDVMQVSLFAENAVDHAHITGTKAYPKVVDNLLRVTAYKKKMKIQKPFIQVFMMSCKETANLTDPFLKFWGEHADQAFVRPLYNVGRNIPGMTPLFEKTGEPDRYPCITPWYATAICSTGNVLPCYMYHWHPEGWHESVGNINEQTLEEIWASQKFQDFRRAHLALDFSNYPICQNCDLWSAYTNIWKKMGEKQFSYDSVKLKDLVTKAPEYRGG